MYLEVGRRLLSSIAEVRNALCIAKLGNGRSLRRLRGQVVGLVDGCVGALEGRGGGGWRGGALEVGVFEGDAGQGGIEPLHVAAMRVSRAVEENDKGVSASEAVESTADDVLVESVDHLYHVLIAKASRHVLVDWLARHEGKDKAEVRGVWHAVEGHARASGGRRRRDGGVLACEGEPCVSC